MSAPVHVFTPEQIDTIVRAHLRAHRPDVRVSDCDVFLISGENGAVQIHVLQRECHETREPDPSPARPTKPQDTRWQPRTVSA